MTGALSGSSFEVTFFISVGEIATTAYRTRGTQTKDEPVLGAPIPIMK